MTVIIGILRAGVLTRSAALNFTSHAEQACQTFKLSAGWERLTATCELQSGKEASEKPHFLARDSIYML